MTFRLFFVFILNPISAFIVYYFNFIDNELFMYQHYLIFDKLN